MNKHALAIHGGAGTILRALMTPEKEAQYKLGLQNALETGNKILASGGSSEPDILKMMDRVNKLLKTNPQMIQQISKCVSNVMNNQELMDSLAGQITNQDQTLESSSLGES